MTTKVKTCKFCGEPGHTQFYCLRRARKAIKVRKKLKAEGKHAVLWRQTRKEWILQNPPDADDNYFCYLCGVAISKGKPDTPFMRMTLDHVKSRSRHPELRYELSNLKPCCWFCNRRKGSRDLDEMQKGLTSG